MKSILKTLKTLTPYVVIFVTMNLVMGMDGVGCRNKDGFARLTTREVQDVTDTTALFSGLTNPSND